MRSVVVLHRCSLCCCGTAARVVATLRQLAVLQTVTLRHYGAAAAHGAVTRRRGELRLALLLFFFLNDYWQVQESSTSLPIHAKKRETESKREQERALKPILVLVFQAPLLSSDPSPIGWQWCKNISSLQPAPSSSANNISSKKKFKNSTSKEFCCFQN